jgi:hypothetical protein
MMKITLVCRAIAIVLMIVNLSASTAAADNGFQERRQQLLEMLSDPGLFPVRHESFTKELQSRQWQFFHASLAQGLRLEESNEYFASREVHSDEWLALMMLNTYCEFKESLTAEGRGRMRDIVLAYARGLEHRQLDAITKASNENHLINWKTIYLLADQEFGGRRSGAAQASPRFFQTMGSVSSETRHGRVQLASLRCGEFACPAADL